MSGRRKRKQHFKQWAPPKAQEDTSPESDAGSREHSGRLRKKLALLVGAALAVSLVVVSTFFFVARPFGSPGPPRAAIVDQLSLTVPNPAFVERSTDLLEEDGYEVDYFPGEEVTVDFYRELPTRDYDLIVFRVHAARRPEVLSAVLPDEAALFTAEPYSRGKYIEDQSALRLVKVHYDEGDDDFYFGIRSDFITSSMKGSFDGATVVLMGCNGLTTSRTAEAFVRKGAQAVIGWDELVSASHTDTATERLLENVVAEGLSVEEAVAQTMQEVGPDPAFDSTLRVYPSEG